MKRQLIIKKLEQEGVFSMNKELDFPVVPQRIAIISSKNAAGYSDFINHLNGNSFGYFFYTALIDTTMQGSKTEQGVIDALDRIAINSRFFDLVVIIRGGGSQSDLSWFDSYNIAYHVTQFPLPVITGIGHDKDMSVTDMVAYKSIKTPTAVADFLIDSVAVAENHLIEMSSEIKDISRIIIEKNKNRIETSRIKLVPVVRGIMSEIKNRLSGKIIEIINVGKKNIIRAGLSPANQRSRLISAVKSFSSCKKTVLERTQRTLNTCTLNSLNRKSLRLEGFGKTLNILRPENVLQRGYTITLLNGMILKKSNQLKSNDLIDTQFSDGSVRSRVVGKERVRGRMGE
jgi:exodeoxyribonuclease VII large subunit